jgi:hypothetical protein
MEHTAKVLSLFGSEQIRGGSAETPEALLGRWGKVKALARLWWNELDDEDLAGAIGREGLTQVIQSRLGRTRDEAELEVNRFLIRVERTLQDK